MISLKDFFIIFIYTISSIVYVYNIVMTCLLVFYYNNEYWRLYLMMEIILLIITILKIIYTSSFIHICFCYLVNFMLALIMSFFEYKHIYKYDYLYKILIYISYCANLVMIVVPLLILIIINICCVDESTVEHETNNTIP
jgi:hypothetical protein